MINPMLNPNGDLTWRTPPPGNPIILSPGERLLVVLNESMLRDPACFTAIIVTARGEAYTPHTAQLPPPGPPQPPELQPGAPIPPPPQGGYYYTPIIINSTIPYPLYNYTILILVNSTNFKGWSLVADEGGSDIYFMWINESGQWEPLYYWIQYFNKTMRVAAIWVKVPLIPASSEDGIVRPYTVIFMFYGNPDHAYKHYNDPKELFLLFDDFTDPAYTNELWLMPEECKIYPYSINNLGQGWLECSRTTTRLVNRNPLDLNYNYLWSNVDITILGLEVIATHFKLSQSTLFIDKDDDPYSLDATLITADITDIASLVDQWWATRYCLSWMQAEAPMKLVTARLGVNSEQAWLIVQEADPLKHQISTNY
jgi:hypothetical protein